MLRRCYRKLYRIRPQLRPACSAVAIRRPRLFLPETSPKTLVHPASFSQESLLPRERTAEGSARIGRCDSGHSSALASNLLTLAPADDTYDPFTFPYTYDPSRPLPPISRPPGFPLLTREMLLPADWFPAVDPDAPRQEMPVWNGEGLDDILAKPSTTSSPTPTPTPAPAPVEPVEEVQQVDPPELETAELDDSDSDDSDYSDAASSLLEDSDCPDGSETSDEGDASDECGEFDDTDDEDSEDESEQDDSYNESSCDEDASVTDAEEATTAETQVADAAQAFEADVAADEQASASTAQTVPDQDTALSDTETDAFDALPEPFSIPLRRTAAVRWPQTSDSRARRSPNSPPRRKKLRHFARGIGSLRDKRGIEAVPRGESDIDDYIHKHDIMYPFYEPSRIRNADSEVDDEPRRPAPRRKNRYQTLERSRPAFKRSRTRTYRATSTDTDSSDDEDEVCDSSAPQRVSRVDFLSVVTRLKTRLSFLAAARKRFNRLISVTLYGTAAPEATAANENDAVGLDSSLDGETAEEAIAHETTQFTFTPPDELPNNLSVRTASILARYAADFAFAADSRYQRRSARRPDRTRVDFGRRR